MSNPAPQENKMGVMPVNRLLITMSLPMVVSMLVQALYNIVDSMFVAQLSEDALTAVSLAFPVQNLMIAVATGTGVGVNAQLSKSLGQRDFDAANKIANNSILLAGICSVVFALAGIFFAGPFYALQTDIPSIAGDGAIYLAICCICSFGPFLQIAFEKLLQSTGKTMYSMIVQITGAVVNIILDPIMIFGLFGFPKMGVAGAALATVIGEIVAMILAWYFNKTKNNDIHLRMKGFRPDGGIIKRIYAVGVPSIVMSSIGSVMTFGMNKILIAFSSTATAVFGVYFKLQSFVFMPVFGLNNGVVPIVSYNYGARKPDRIRKTIRLSITYAMSIMVVGAALFWLLTPQLLGFFQASETMLEIGVPALRIISISFLFAGYCISCSSVFQALGKGLYSLSMSVVRQLVVLLPVAYILSHTIGLGATWWAFPIAEIFSVTLSTIFIRRIFAREIRPMERELEAA